MTCPAYQHGEPSLYQSLADLLNDALYPPANAARTAAAVTPLTMMENNARGGSRLCTSCRCQVGLGLNCALNSSRQELECTLFHGSSHAVVSWQYHQAFHLVSFCERVHLEMPSILFELAHIYRARNIDHRIVSQFFCRMSYTGAVGACHS